MRSLRTIYDLLIQCLWVVASNEGQEDAVQTSGPGVGGGYGWDRVHNSVVHIGGWVLWAIPGCTLQGVETRLDWVPGASRVAIERNTDY